MSDYIKRDDVKSALNGACVLYHTETIDRIPSADVVEVVHCKSCEWYDPPHIEYKDGTREDYPKESFVTADIGLIVGGTCKAKNKIYCTAHDRENPDDYEEIVMFRNPDDYCSYGERKDDTE